MPTPGSHAGLDWSSVTSRTLRLSTTRSLPTGAPEIEGTARMGETLEAATDAIADADGLSNPGFAYQWIRVEGVEETEISGADARTYTVTAEDLGKAVRVRVRFTDDRSFAEEATSAALPIVNTPATGAPEIRGSGRVGGTMRAATGGIVEPDGLGNAAFSYRWVRLDGAEETEVGTDSDSYGVVAADEGKRIRVEVTFTDDLGAAEGPLASIPATVLDASPPLSSSCGPPELAGRVQIWNSRVTLSTSFSGGIGFDHEQSGRRLQDPDFVIASAPAYTFLSALNFVGGSRNGGLRFELDRALAPSHAASLVLHDCDDSFAFADAAYSASDLHLQLARRRGRLARAAPDAGVAPERAGEQPGDGRAGDCGDGAGRRDADGADRRDPRRGRALGRELRLPVAAGRGRDGDGDFRGGGGHVRRSPPTTRAIGSRWRSPSPTTSARPRGRSRARPSRRRGRSRRCRRR